MSAGTNAYLAASEVRRILDAANDAVRYLDRVAEMIPEAADEVDGMRRQLRAVGDLARTLDEGATSLYDRARAL